MLKLKILPLIASITLFILLCVVCYDAYWDYYNLWKFFVYALIGMTLFMVIFIFFWKIERIMFNSGYIQIKDQRELIKIKDQDMESTIREALKDNSTNTKFKKSRIEKEYILTHEK